jgi:hypothetical protein
MAEPMVPNPIRSKDLLAVSPPKKSQSQAQAPQMALKTSAEIIEQSARREAPGQDMSRFMQTLGYMVQRNMVQLLQIGNTVFMLKPLPDQPGAVEFHTFTIESPQDLVKRYQAGINSLRQMGYKKAVSYATSPAFVKLAEQTGLPVRVSQSQTMMGDQMTPAYRFEVDV